MRRTGILIFPMVVAALAWTHPAHGQLSASVAAGATYSNMGGSLISSSDSDWGVLLGGALAYQFEAHLIVQLETNWVQKGGRGTVDAERIDLDLDYIEIPVTAQFAVGLSPAWTWNLYGGIALAFKTACDLSRADAAKQSCEEVRPGWDIKSTEWSVPFGTSFSYGFARSSLTADLRYSYGLSAAIDPVDLKNRSWQFIIRWGFDI